MRSSLVMDDDDDCLFDLIGDPQALNYFLHGPDSKSPSDDLTNPGYSESNSSKIFTNSSDTDSKSSIKGVNSQFGEGSSDGLQRSSSLQFLEDDLETSSLPEINEDQPFDILQKSLQEANITEQTLAEEAYLDANISSSQTFAQAQLQPPSSASFTQASDLSNCSGQTLHPIGVTHLPVGASFSGSTAGTQHGFMQHVGISVPNQHLSNSNQISGSGQIQLISSFNSQPSMMTINNIDGSHIIFKGSGQQPTANTGGGVLVHRHTPNGNSMFGSSNSNPVGQGVSVPFSSPNFQTSLPVHNIIIQRGLAPNANKIPINIQPKPLQMGQHAAYNMNNVGLPQHHIQQGIPFASANSPQSSSLCPQMSVNIVNQQNSRQLVPPQSLNNAGGNIVIHSPLGQHHAHQNPFLIPTSMSVTSNSVHHVQTINGQLMQTQQTHLVPSQVSAEHVMQNRNSSSMIRSNQPYSGQMLSNQNTSVQLVSGQTFTGPGGHVLVNHGSSQIGQMPLQQASPTILHVSPSQGNVPQCRSHFATMSTGQSPVPGMPVSNRFTVVCSGTLHHSVGNSVQTSASGAHMFGDQLSHQNRSQVSVSMSHHLPVSSSQSTNSFSDSHLTQQTYSCCQKNLMSQHSPVSLSQTQEGLRQPQLSSLLSSTSLSAGQGTGWKMLQHPLGPALPQQDKAGVSLPLQQNMQVDGNACGLKRPAAKQLTKSFVLQRLNKDQAHVETPDKRKFSSLNDAVQKLLSYHLFQGSTPNKEDLTKVDNEFECVASRLLHRTQAMLNKYRLLLLEDAMRVNPSAEMVMIDRMFNQEERAALTREKRLTIVDPDTYQADFCCASKFLQKSAEEMQSSDSDHASNKTASSLSRKPWLQNVDLGASSNTEPANHGTLHLLPNNIAMPQKTKKSYSKSEKLCKSLKSERVSSSFGIQNMKFYGKEISPTTLTDSNDTSSECKVLSRRMIKPEVGTDTLLCGSVELNTETKCMHSLQTNISSEDVPEDTVKITKDPHKEVLLNKSLETTFTNILELKKNGSHSRGEIDGCSSAELECSHLLPLASQENCQEKLIPDHHQVVAETDSILEAAVNSILEC